MKEGGGKRRECEGRKRGEISDHLVSLSDLPGLPGKRNTECLPCACNQKPVLLVQGSRRPPLKTGPADGTPAAFYCKRPP